LKISIFKKKGVIKINHKQKKAVIFSLLVIVSFIFFVKTGDAAQLKVRVIVKDAEIRLKPNAEAVFISRVPLGAVLESEEKKGKWFQVTLPPDEKGFVVSGYIHQDKVTVIGESEEKTKEKKRTEEKKAEAKIKVEVIIKEAKIRLEPDHGSQIIGQAPLGTVLECKSKMDEWYKVEIVSNVFGYIHQDHIKALGEVEDIPSGEEKEKKVLKRIEDKKDSTTDFVPAARKKGYFSIGLGYGIPYGTLGMNCEFNTIFPTEEKVFDYFGITAGLGYFTGGIKYVFGLRGYPLARKGNWWPRISIYYGTVAFYERYDGTHKNASGPAFGVGIVWMRAKKILIDIELQYRIPSMPAGYVKEEGLDFTLSAGIQYNF